MMKHPAKYTDCLLPIFSKYLKNTALVLDPFAGTGKLKEIIPNAILLEIEPEWAEMGGAVIADSQHMPLRDNVFDAVCTSPTYGNRMADHFIDHQTHKNYVRNTYRHCLGRSLNPNNSGRMQWGNKYKELHTVVWKECERVLKKGGLFILNVSDHIRAGKQIYVSDWHVKILTSMKFELLESLAVETPRQRMGKNSELRVGCEHVFIFKRVS